jgi:hypothetical protein
MFIGFYKRCQVSHALGITGAKPIGNHGLPGRVRKSAFDPFRTRSPKFNVTGLHRSSMDDFLLLLVRDWIRQVVMCVAFAIMALLIIFSFDL